MSQRKLRVIADRDLAGVSVLADSGYELTLLPGREIGRASVQDHDALLVRSITRVDEHLLDNTGVRFVGTATSGLDHVDQTYLLRQGITLAHAAGSNANAVVDYCLSAMAVTGMFSRSTPPTVGVVGCGQVGSRLFRRLSGMGIATLLCDPLLARRLPANEQRRFTGLAELASCDVVSLHVPLTSIGDHPSKGMIDGVFLDSMSPDALLVHTARGGIVDEAALLARLQARTAPHCVFDVWMNEPHVNADLVVAVDFATPHIAGYSRLAKFAATEMILGQLRRFADLEEAQEETFAAAGEDSGDGCSWLQTELASYPTNAHELAGQFVAAFDLAGLSERFKQAVHQAPASGLAATDFDTFRRELRDRSEFSEMRLRIALEALSPTESGFLQSAGFNSGTSS